MREWQPRQSRYFACLVAAVEDEPSRFDVEPDFYFEPGAEDEFLMHDGKGITRQVRYVSSGLEIMRPLRSQFVLFDCAPAAEDDAIGDPISAM